MAVLCPDWRKDGVLMREFDLIKESETTVQEEIRGLQREIRELRGSIEDLSALLHGALTGQKVSKL